MTYQTSSSQAVPFRDNARVYGFVTRLLHWVMALLLFWQFLGMILNTLYEDEPFVEFFAGSHVQVGVTLFVLILLRIIWAFVNRNSRPDHGAGLVGIAARAGHGLMYTLMLMIPSIALIRAWGSERALEVFGIGLFPAREAAIGWTQTLGGALHGEFAWILGLLILGHIGMALLHEFALRDGTLSKILGRPR